MTIFKNNTKARNKMKPQIYDGDILITLFLKYHNSFTDKTIMKEVLLNLPKDQLNEEVRLVIEEDDIEKTYDQVSGTVVGIATDDFQSEDRQRLFYFLITRLARMSFKTFNTHCAIYVDSGLNESGMFKCSVKHIENEDMNVLFNNYLEEADLTKEQKEEYWNVWLDTKK